MTQLETLLSRALQDGSPIAIDSSALIAYFSDEELLAGLVGQVLESDALILISTITLSESLVRMIQLHGRAAAEKISVSLQESSSIYLAPFGTMQLVEAAEIRAETRLKLPDAAIVATARVAGAIAIIGNNRVWQTRPLGIQYIHLDDVVREAAAEEISS